MKVKWLINGSDRKISSHPTNYQSSIVSIITAANHAPNKKKKCNKPGMITGAVVKCNSMQDKPEQIFPSFRSNLGSLSFVGISLDIEKEGKGLLYGITSAVHRR